MRSSARTVGILALTATVLTVSGCGSAHDADKGVAKPSGAQSAPDDGRSSPAPRASAGRGVPTDVPHTRITCSASPEVLEPLAPNAARNPLPALERTPDAVSMHALQSLFGFDTTVDEHPIDSAVRAESGGLLVTEGIRAAAAHRPCGSRPGGHVDGVEGQRGSHPGQRRQGRTRRCVRRPAGHRLAQVAGDSAIARDRRLVGKAAAPHRRARTPARCGRRGWRVDRLRAL
jgi:hypothetical protein